MYLSKSDINKFNELMRLYGCERINPSRVSENWKSLIYERSIDSKQVAIYDRKKGIYLRLENYNGTTLDVTVKDKPPAGDSFEMAGSKFKNGKGVCVVAPNMLVAAEILNYYFHSSHETSNLIEPQLFANESDLDDRVKELLEEGIDGIPRGNSTPKKKSISGENYRRDALVKAYVLLQAGGVCESCQRAGPFISSSNGTPYLEVHHVKYLEQGGSDTISNTVAVCPNCHRELHYGEDRSGMKKTLYSNVSRLKIE